MIPSLIAICGPKTAGKTTLSQLIQCRYHHIALPFTGPLKGMLEFLLCHQGLSWVSANEMLNGPLKETPSPYLGGATPRHAMQTLGTEWRDLISKTLWTEMWERAYQRRPSPAVVDDMRFPHEAAAIRRHSGFIIAVHRDGCGPGDHASEREFLQIVPDLAINNNGAPEDMLHALETR